MADASLMPPNAPAPANTSIALARIANAIAFRRDLRAKMRRRRPIGTAYPLSQANDKIELGVTR
jgi:hypothetical protein